MYTLENSIPTFESKVVNYKNEYIDIEEKKNKEIIKSTFNYLFKMEMKKDYWNMLFNMIKNISKSSGLVAIDQMSGNKMEFSYGLVFNLGRPKLRSRKIHYMPRIYAQLCSDSENFVTFYNSKYDIKDEDTIWQWEDMHVAYHPHISHGKPCLGNFYTDLEKAIRDKNPMLYLLILNNFVNTWNARSPFFNIHHQQQDFVFERLKGPNKKYKEWHIKERYTVAILDGYPEYSYSKFRNYVHEYIGKVNSGNIKSDIKYIYELFALSCNNSNTVKSNIESILSLNGTDGYLEELNYVMNHRTEDFPRIYSNIHSPIPVMTNLIIPYEDKIGEYNVTKFRVSRLRFGHNYQHTKMLPLYRYKDKLLKELSYFISDIRIYYRKNKMAERILINKDMPVENLFFKYIAKSRFYNQPTKLAFRRNRIKKLMAKKIENSLDEKIVMNHLDEYVNEAFKFQIVSNNNFDGSKQEYIDKSESGKFWRSSSYNRYNDELIEVMKLLHPFPVNIKTLFDTYEKIKKSLIQEDIEHIINNHKKHIGALENYGYKTNNTSKDTQQVHLSFEEV